MNCRTCSIIVLSFLGWLGFSFLCHWSSKQFLSQMEMTSGWRNGASAFIAAVVISVTQVLACIGNLKISPKKEDSVSGQDSVSDTGVLVWALFAHVLASFATNYSLAMMKASQTLMIKLLEPLMSAFILWWSMRKPLSKTTFLSLCLVIIGAMGFVRTTQYSGTSVGIGTFLAIISNLLYGLRNVIVKHIMGGTTINLCDPVDYAISYFSIGAVYGLVLVQPDDFFPNGPGFTLALAACSGLCHVAYSYISTSIVLSYFSVVAHAVANIGKRVLVVVLLMIYGDKFLPITAFVWLAVAAFGLSIYVREKITKQQQVSSAGMTSESQTVEATCPMRKVKLLIIVLSIILSAICFVTTTMMPNTIGTVKRYKDLSPPNELQNDPGRPSYRVVSSASKLQEDVFKTLIRDHKKISFINLPVETSDGAFQSAGLLAIAMKLELEFHVICLSNKCNDFSISRALNDTRITIIFISVENIDEGILKTTLDEAKNSKREVVLFDQWNKLNDYSDVVTDGSYLVTNARSKANEKRLSIPHLGLSIGKKERFIYPLYDVVVLLNSSSYDVCSGVKGFNMTCVSNNWDTKWRLPKSQKTIDRIYLDTYSRFMCSLRGKIIVTDHLAGHVAASIFGIPHVVILENDEVKRYFETWAPDPKEVFLVKGAEYVVDKLEVMFEEIGNTLPSFDKAKAAVKISM